MAKQGKRPHREAPGPGSGPGGGAGTDAPAESSGAGAPVRVPWIAPTLAGLHRDGDDSQPAPGHKQQEQGTYYLPRNVAARFMPSLLSRVLMCLCPATWASALAQISGPWRPLGYMAIRWRSLLR